MTVVMNFGNTWIEVLTCQVTVEDAAGEYLSGAQTLEKPGTFIGASYIGRGDGGSIEVGSSLGQIAIRTNADANMNVGNHIFDFQIRVQKQITTAGSTAIAFTVMMFMRKTS